MVSGHRGHRHEGAVLDRVPVDVRPQRLGVRALRLLAHLRQVLLRRLQLPLGEVHDGPHRWPRRLPAADGDAAVRLQHGNAQRRLPGEDLRGLERRLALGEATLGLGVLASALDRRLRALCHGRGSRGHAHALAREVPRPHLAGQRHRHGVPEGLHEEPAVPSVPGRCSGQLLAGPWPRLLHPGRLPSVGGTAPATRPRA
mmetsp:Transcript_27646/g.69382  ORF Transcript_27646/g.69382 Transcript_27646/m.69382 type:complete len:200 (-) Transcript_27646:1104-1703(-)